MKKFMFINAMLVVIFFCGIAQAQDTIRVNDFHNGWAVTMQDVWKYQKECYNDSTAHYYYTFCDMECWDVSCNKGDKNSMGGDCLEHWTHRVATFEGFAEWLRKKYYH